MKTHDYKVFKCFSRKFKIGGVEPPPYVKLIFAKYSGGGTHIDTAHLLRFMAEVQGEEGSTLADAERIVEEIARRRHIMGELSDDPPRTLTLDEFFQYLLADDLNQAIKTEVSVFSVFQNSTLVFSVCITRKHRKRKGNVVDGYSDFRCTMT